MYQQILIKAGKANTLAYLALKFYRIDFWDGATTLSITTPSRTTRSLMKPRLSIMLKQLQNVLICSVILNVIMMRVIVLNIILMQDGMFSCIMICIEMHSHGQTLAYRTSLGLSFHFRSGCMQTMNLLHGVAIHTNLELKTRPKQLLGSLKLVITLPSKV